MARLSLQPASIPGVSVIERQRLGDSRGYFERLYCTRELSEVLGTREIRQINHSFTQAKGSVRGLHFQRPPLAELKIVTCLRGEVFDVAVDLRAGSDTFLQWHAEVLSGNSHQSLLIPEGFAHGFQTLSEDCELLYFHTQPYDPELEGGVDCLDQRIGIQWPLEVAQRSERDARLPRTDTNFEGISLA